MIDHLLQAELEPIARRYQRWWLYRNLGRSWSVATLAGLVLILTCLLTGWRLSLAPILLLLGATAAAVVIWRRGRRMNVDHRAIARQIEQEDSRLRALLLTAAEQQPDATRGELNYLQQRVVREALVYNRMRPWGQRSVERLFLSQCGHWVVLALFLVTLAGLRYVSPAGGTSVATWLSGVTVLPGDTVLERGRSLVVLARFQRGLPKEATLIVKPVDGGERRIPLTKSLDDPVFGGTVAEVQSDLAYRIEYGGQQTRGFTVTVFEYPKLERADARLTFPQYTGLAEKTIEDTRRISAVEGTRLDYTLFLNKPVASARLAGNDKSALPLAADAARSKVVHLAITLLASRRYELQLVDEAGRTNPLPAEFVFEVFTNRVPELKLASPRGDQRVSPLEEIAFEAEAADDFGLRAYGLAYTLAGGETKFVELGQSAAAHEKRSMRHVLALEELSAQPDQLLTCFLWADDLGPDGNVRRTSSDIFFAEIRPFDEIFREDQSSASASASQGQAQTGSPATRLAELQKDIVIATWNLQRRETGNRSRGHFQEDLGVIHESQQQALEQAGALKAQNDDPRSQPLLEAVEQEMSRAVARLTQAGKENSPSLLPPALSAEQAAYQAVLRLQAREYQVARRQNSRGGSSRGERAQRQLDQLELKPSENRYETAREAAPAQDAGQREQLRVLSRLKELARRQQDLNERLKELQTALQETRNEAEREEIRRRLKRLREEEQELLADVDELRQRLERPENQSRLTDARQRLDETRSEVQRAAEAMDEGAVSRALASGTRAQRELQDMREDFRRKSASQFADDLRQMRDDARQLLKQEEEIRRQLGDLATPAQKPLSDSEERNALADQLSQQTRRQTNLFNAARRVSEQSETAEPLLSKQLQDTFRKATQDDASNLQELTQDLLQQGVLKQSVYELLRNSARVPAGPSLSATEELLRQGHVPEARLLERKAQEDLDAFKRGIERAAGSVLGDDVEALRLARRELEDLGRELENEVAQGESRRPQARASQANESPRREGTDPARPEASGRRDSPATGQRPEGGSVAQGQTNRFFEQTGGADGGGPWFTGPLTGPDFRRWIDRLVEVEELIERSELREEIARVRDRARGMRIEFKRHGQEPQWELVKAQITTPLAEVRQRIDEELARRQSPEALVPVDRDPVPHKYSELVRRYYEQLGK